MRFSFELQTHLFLQLIAILRTSHTVLVVSEVPRKPFEKATHPIVHTAVGSIRGLWADDGDYSMFMGVPYAQVDQNNVFGPALPYPAFKEVFDAFNDSAKCPQIEEYNYTIAGTLDCLHLNIYVPNSASTENLLPVMVYIYGGFFSLGFASRFIYGPQFIVRHDVILVTLNYRLGPYGFMCLDTPAVPGNEGLKDQVKALRWIKENIASFGGDNSRVTLVGNSAGAMATDLHWYFDQEQLFHRLILQSGVALVNTVIKKTDPTAPFKLAELLNYTTNNIKDALSFLSAVDPYQLIAASNESGLVFGPCVEKQHVNIDNFITKHPINVKTRRVQDVDILIGFNDDETVSTSWDRETFDSVDYLYYVIDSYFDFNGENKLFDEIKQIVRHFYFGDGEQNAEKRRPAIDLLADFVYYNPILRTIQKYLDSGVENLYLYLFSYTGGRNFIKDKENMTDGGATHADELGYLFDISYMKKPLQAKDKLIMERMTELWTNFIKYGNPTPRPTELIPLQWPRVTQDKLHYLQIDTELRLDTRPMRERMSFLDLIYKMNDQYQRGLDRPASTADRHAAFSVLLLLAIVYIVKCY